MLRITRPEILVALFAASFAPPVAAQCDLVELQAPAQAYFDEYGEAIALRGDLALVGAPHASYVAFEAGAVHVFERTANVWAHLGFVTAADGAIDDHLGNSCVFLGDTIVSGARKSQGAVAHAGSVYFYERSGNTWNEVLKLFPLDGQTGDNFGWSLAVEPGRLVVGAKATDDGALNAGSVYVYEGSGANWVQTAELHASDPIAQGGFGEAVALVGDVIVVGSLAAQTGPSEQGGAVYVFEKSGNAWVETQKLVASDAEHGDTFGRALSFTGDTILVGSPRDSDAGSWSGSVYVFERPSNAWLETRKLHSSDAEAGDEFGHALVLVGDKAVITSRGDDDLGDNTGAAYTFERSGASWYELDKFYDPNPQPDDTFGHRTTGFGTEFMISKTRHDDPPFPTGGAFVRSTSGSASNYCTTSPNTVGAGALISMGGSLAVSVNDFHLRVDGATPSEFGLFYYGGGQAQNPFGDGVQCIGPGSAGIFRLLPAVTTDGNGSLDRLVDFTQPPAGSGPGAIDGGSTWNFQFWYRDPASVGAGFNFSDALSVLFCP